MNAGSRDWILDRVRAAAHDGPALPAMPSFDRPPPSLEAFGAALARMGGLLAMPAADASLDDWLRDRFPDAKVIVSATGEVQGTRALPDAGAALEDVDVGVVRAAFGIVETGSVFVGEREFGLDAIGFLPQHLVVLLDPAALLADLHAAYAHPAFRERRYAALMTGPSATADIEGILVRGAQGVRSLTVLAWPA